MPRTKRWLNGMLNGTDKDAPTWRGNFREEHGDYYAKFELLQNLKRQAGLPLSYSFVAGKAVNPATKQAVKKNLDIIKLAVAAALLTLA